MLDAGRQAVTLAAPPTPRAGSPFTKRRTPAFVRRQLQSGATLHVAILPIPSTLRRYSPVCFPHARPWPPGSCIVPWRPRAATSAPNPTTSTSPPRLRNLPAQVRVPVSSHGEVALRRL